MDTVSFTTGFALGLSRSSGGAGGDIAFHEIISNSKAVKTIPINNKFRFTLNVMQVWVDPFESGIGINSARLGDPVYETGSRSYNDICYGSVIYYTMLMGYIVAYENNVPIFANKCGQMRSNSSSISMGVDNGKVVALPYGEDIYDVSSAEITSALSLWKPTDTYFTHQIYNADDNYSTRIQIENITFIYHDYYRGSDPDGDYAYIARTDTNTGSAWLSSPYTYGGDAVTYTDMTTPQYIAKYQEITAAINAEHGVEYRTAEWGRIYDHYPG